MGAYFYSALDHVEICNSDGTELGRYVHSSAGDKYYRADGSLVERGGRSKWIEIPSDGVLTVKIRVTNTRDRYSILCRGVTASYEDNGWYQLNLTVEPDEDLFLQMRVSF